jgi:hypothetical protein
VEADGGAAGVEEQGSAAGVDEQGAAAGVDEQGGAAGVEEEGGHRQTGRGVVLLLAVLLECGEGGRLRLV